MRSLDFIFKEAIPPSPARAQEWAARRAAMGMAPSAVPATQTQPAAAPIVNRDINQPDAVGRIAQLAGTAPAQTPAGVVSSDGKPVVSSDGQQVQAGHTVPAGSPGAAQLPNAGLPPVTQPVDPDNADADDLALGQTMTANAANAADQKNLANLDMQVGQGTPRAPTAQQPSTPPAQAPALKPGETVDTWREPSGTSQTTFTPGATKPAATAGGYPGGISQADAEKKYGKTGAEIIRLGGMDAYNKRPKDAAGNLALLKQLQAGQPAAATGATAPASNTTAAPAAAAPAAAAPAAAANPAYGTPNDPRQGRGYGQPNTTGTSYEIKQGRGYGQPTAQAAPAQVANKSVTSSDATVPYDVARPFSKTQGMQLPSAASAATAQQAAKPAAPTATTITSTTSANVPGNPESHPNYPTYYQQELAKNNRAASATGQQIAATQAANRVQADLAQAKSGSQVSVNGAPPVQVGGGQAPASQTLKQGAQSKIERPFVMSNLNKNPNNFIVEYNKMTSVEKMQYLRSIIMEAPPPNPNVPASGSRQAQQWLANQTAQGATSSVTTPTGATSTTITGTQLKLPPGVVRAVGNLPTGQQAKVSLFSAPRVQALTDEFARVVAYWYDTILKNNPIAGGIRGVNQGATRGAEEFGQKLGKGAVKAGGIGLGIAAVAYDYNQGFKWLKSLWNTGQKIMAEIDKVTDPAQTNQTQTSQVLPGILGNLQMIQKYYSDQTSWNALMADPDQRANLTYYLKCVLEGMKNANITIQQHIPNLNPDDPESVKEFYKSKGIDATIANNLKCAFQGTGLDAVVANPPTQ